MNTIQNFWQRLSQAILSPQLDPQYLEAEWQQARARLPVPVVWLLGKTQSGKTSIIRQLTGSSEAEIGDGFRPCTRYSRCYDFPNAEQPLVRFLDTRGLGEVGYEPSADLQLFQQQAHVLLVVMRALDPAQAQIVELVRQIHQHKPHWPLLVVQTCLHQGYAPGADHPAQPDDRPQDVQRALLAQQQLFTGLPAEFVAIDFTVPEDGYNPLDYGATALWQALEHNLPQGVARLLEASSGLKQAYAQAAQPHIISYAVLAGSLDLVPLPGVMLPVVMALQAKLCHSLATLYQQPWNKQRLAELGAALGSGFALRMGGRQLAKLIPVYGSAVAALTTAASTYALGQVTCLYLESLRQGKPLVEQQLAEHYREQLRLGRELLQTYFKR